MALGDAGAIFLVALSALRCIVLATGHVVLLSLDLAGEPRIPKVRGSYL